MPLFHQTPEECLYLRNVVLRTDKQAILLDIRTQAEM